MPKMTFITTNGERKEVEAPNGLSILEIAHIHEIDLEGACEGSLACSTCHVIIDQSWFTKLETATEDEEWEDGEDPCMHIVRLYSGLEEKKSVEANHSPTEWRAANLGWAQ